MLNPTSLLADALGRNLAETYRRIYADREPYIASVLDEAARLALGAMVLAEARQARQEPVVEARKVFTFLPAQLLQIDASEQDGPRNVYVWPGQEPER